MSEPLLEASRVWKSFSGSQVLEDVSLQLQPGQIHALVGENGAGKSTLIKILTGVYDIDRGDVFLKGKRVRFAGPRDALAKGVGVVHQEMELVPSLTVQENIMLGREKTFLAVLSRLSMNRTVEALLDRYSMRIPRRALVESLSTSERQRVMIARALLAHPSVVIFDEPTARLEASDAAIVLGLLKSLATEGKAVLFVSQRLEEVLAVADVVTVMRDGRVAERRPAAAWSVESLIQAMVGRDLAATSYVHPLPGKEVVLSVRDVKVRGAREPLSFDLHCGEVLGIYGLVGSGKTDVAKVIFGASEKKKIAQMERGAARYRPRHPADAIARRVGLVPQERRSQGLLQDKNILENVMLPNLEEFSHWRVLVNSRGIPHIRTLLTTLRVQYASERQLAKFLSGGNQQKLVLVKWLASGAEIILLDEPTTGIDVGAKHDIYEYLLELAKNGRSLILLSSDPHEIIRLCHRVLVLRDGELIREMPLENVSVQQLLEVAVRSENGGAES